MKDKLWAPTFGRTLKGARPAGISQEAVTDQMTAVGLRKTKGYLSKLEAGLREKPDFLVVWLLSRIYRTGLDTWAEALYADRATRHRRSTADAISRLRRTLPAVDDSQMRTDHHLLETVRELLDYDPDAFDAWRTAALELAITRTRRS